MFRRCRKLTIVAVTLVYCSFAAYIWSMSSSNRLKPRLSGSISLKPSTSLSSTSTSTSTQTFMRVSLFPSNFSIHTATDSYEHPLDPKFPLSGSLMSPTPAYALGKLSDYMDVVIGITTVKREKGDYLLDTIESLQKNLGVDKSKVAIVVYIGETDQEYIFNRAGQIVAKFPNLIASGFLQIVSPPVQYYPADDWSSVLKTNFGDPIERVKWRSKQNLDQIFLMMYIYHYSPSYYLMMEDDVIAYPDYMAKLLKEAEKRTKDEWFFLSFSELGAIGKLFHCSSLPSYASFIHTFWNKKPLDWLQDDYVSSAYCSPDEGQKQCNERKGKLMVKVRPSLFQHMGKYSSLNGKIQNRKDKYFPKRTK